MNFKFIIFIFFCLASQKLFSMDSPELTPLKAFPNAAKKYCFIKRLGRKRVQDQVFPYCGFNAAAFLALVGDSSSQVAIKVIYSDWNMTPEAVYSHNKAEIETHKSLCTLEDAKKFIVQYYTHWVERVDPAKLPDWDKDKKTYNYNSLFFAMEYVPWNLEQFRVEYTLREPEVCIIVCQIAKWIEFLQQNNIVHRDLKENNILIDESGGTLICDLGYALSFAPGDNLSYPFHDFYFKKGGARYFAPPEILAQEPGEGVYLDYSTYATYSLGIIIGELISNCSPGLKKPVDGMISKDVNARPHVKTIIEDFSGLLFLLKDDIKNEFLLKAPALEDLRAH